MSTVSKGKVFENKVAELYRLMGYEVKQNVGILGHQIDIILVYTMPGGIKAKTAVECKYVGAGNLKKNDVMDNINAITDLKRNYKIQNSIIVTTNGFAKDIWDTAEENEIRLLTIKELQAGIINFDPYINRIIYDFEHWGEYGDGQRKPIIELFERANLHEYYVLLRCRDSSGVIYDPIDKYIEDWINKDDKNHITLLGDYGTGKSSFLLYLTYILAKSFKDDPFNRPIPIFISLKNYNRIKDIKEMILGVLKNDYNILISSSSNFQSLLEDGKIILLLDGFDEMESKSNKDVIIQNFEEITKLVTKKSKVILTSRTHYFKTHSQVKDIFNPQYDTDLLKMIRGNHRFEIVELLEFNNEQIIEFLQNHVEDYMAMWGKIKSTYNLEDLSKRPILLEMIIRSLPALIKAGREINSSELYEIYTNIWIKRDDWRSVMKPDEKATIMEELSLHMFLDNIQSVYYTELNHIVLEHFKSKIASSEDEDIFDTDTRTCSFLNRDHDGNYKFVHKSFMEFFVAKKFYKEINENKIVFFRNKPLPPEIIDFISNMKLDKNKLYDAICITVNSQFEEVEYMGGNAISILTHMGETFNNKDFSNTVLRNANFEGAVCDSSDFSNAELQNSNFIDSSLLYVNFERAKLDGSLIEGIGHISSISLDKKDKNLAFGTVTGNAYIIDLNTFKKINSIKQTNYCIEKIRFFDEDKLLGFIDSNKHAFVFDLTSFGQCIMKQKIMKDADFNPSRAEIALLSSDRRIKIIDIISKTEKLIDLNDVDDKYYRISYLDNSNLLAIISKNRINIINLENGNLIKSMKIKLNNIDDINYVPKEHSLYLRQSTKSRVKGENYTYTVNYEIVDPKKMESEVINAELMGKISRKYNLMFSVEFNNEQMIPKFKIIDLEPNTVLFNWDNVPGTESNALLKFLKDGFDISLSNTKIHKSDDGKTIYISNYEKIVEIPTDKMEEQIALKISGRTYNIKVKKENDKLIIYRERWDSETRSSYLDEIYSVENFESISENTIDANSGKLVKYLQIYTGYEKIYKSDDGKTIYIHRERLAEVTIDELKEKATLKISNGRIYDLKAKKENGELKIYDEILKESYNNSLKMSYSEENFGNTKNITQKFEDWGSIDRKLQSPTNLPSFEGYNNSTRYIPPIVFSKDAKSVYIADYSGNLILWNWNKESPLKDKEYETWSISHDIPRSKTMLQSRFINQNLFKCDHMNLYDASGVKEGQLQALKRMGAIVEKVLR